MIDDNVNNEVILQDDEEFVDSKINDNLNNKMKEFDGILSKTNGWKQCIYCTKYHPESMYLPEMNYCGHCWGWLNNQQLDLINGNYNGTNTYDEVKNFLKLTYPLHPKTCTNIECVYNKIKSLVTNNKINYNLSIELGFESEKKNIYNTYTVNNKSEYKIKKKSYVKINYNLSNISI